MDLKIQLPTEIATGSLQFAINTISDPGVALLLKIVVGVLLAVVVIEILIYAIRPK